MSVVCECGFTSAAAQDPPIVTMRAIPLEKSSLDGKTALVLSAGGLFGAYQVGAWKHLSRIVQPDMVFGASIGALNGWQIAGGVSANALEQVWLDRAIQSLIQLRPQPNLRNGYFDPAPLLRHIRVIYGRSQPCIPYWLAVVEVPRFRTRLIPAAEVTAEHLLATCSIYRFFPTVEIKGRHFTDGGMFGHLPMWAAVDNGATRIIAIDCMPRMSPWWVQTTISTLHLFGPKRKLPPDVQVLRPSEPLGNAQSAMMFNPGNMKRWMDLGERDAQKQFPE